MKGVGSKPISSPSRGGGAAENYPAPLIMRFLKSNVVTKSRRSRSSPMFVARKKHAAAIIETQEPSSPKVSCIGQVRVRHSNNFTPTKPDRLKQSQGTCTCFSVMKCSTCTPRKLNLRRLVSFFRFGCCKKVDVKENSSTTRVHFDDSETEVTKDGEAQIEDTEEVLRGTTVAPRNALLLTRSRSAPFRSSSLAVQFWGETNSDIADQVKMTSCFRDFDQRERETEKQICASGKQIQGDSSTGKNMEQVDMPHPLLLTRSKSASASKTGKEQA